MPDDLGSGQQTFLHCRDRKLPRAPICFNRIICFRALFGSGVQSRQAGDLAERGGAARLAIRPCFECDIPRHRLAAVMQPLSPDVLVRVRCRLQAPENKVSAWSADLALWAKCESVPLRTFTGASRAPYTTSPSVSVIRHFIFLTSSIAAKHRSRSHMLCRPSCPLFTTRIIARNARSTCAPRESSRPTIPF